jgi:O-antigen/teichoic acid export membrane protein
VIMKNLAASYASVTLASLIGFFIIPILISLIGTEYYGVVAFFNTAQTWFNLIDFGLSPTLAREVSKAILHVPAASQKFTFTLVEILDQTEPKEASDHKPIVSSNFVMLYWVIKLISLFLSGGLALVACVGLSRFSSNWPLAENFNHVDGLIILCCGVGTLWLRLLINLERAIMYGLREMVWLAKYTIGFSIIRYVGSLVPLMLISATLPVYFIFQFIASFVEFCFYSVASLKLIPGLRNLPNRLKFGVLRGHTFFAVSSNVIYLFWITATQSAGFILVKSLSAQQYSLLSLILFIGQGLMILAAPVTNLAQPLLVRHHSRNDQSKIVSTFFEYAHLLYAVVGSIALTLLIFPREFLLLWTHNVQFADNGAKLLSGYLIGMLALVIAQYGNVLSYSLGRTKLQLVVTAFYGIATISILISVKSDLDLLTYIKRWSELSVSYFTIITFINLDLLQIKYAWLKFSLDVGRFIIVPLVLVVLISLEFTHDWNLWLTAIKLIFTSLFTAFCCYYQSPFLRRQSRLLFQK